MDRFEITYYWGPHGQQAADERFYRAIAEAGFTSVPLENCPYDINIRALELMKKYGLTCSALWDNRIYQLIQTLNGDVTDAEIDRITRETADSYAEYREIIRGWWMADEPSAGRFGVLGRVRASFARTDPERTVMVNLFPTYATSGQLGTASYEEYLQKYIDTVKPSYLSYDHYHFLRNGSRAGFFTNIEAIRKAGLKAGLDQMSIILLTCHMGYADVTPEQLSWEVNMSLAYGMKRISYFTFILEPNLLKDGWTDGCMSYTGEIYPHYYEVQKISRWLLPLGRELFAKKSEAVFHIGDAAEAGTEQYTSYGVLGKVAGNSFTAGFFDDGSFLLVNKATEASQGRNALRLQDLRAGLQFFDTALPGWRPADAGCDAVTRNADGQYIISLAPGASMLFRQK